MKPYNHAKRDSYWQSVWEKDKIYETSEKSKKPKCYLLVEFPYPSGDGLHNGHIRSYTAMDIIARKRRSEGYNVLYPIGWDAFGLPTENFAIKNKIHPSIVTKQNTDVFRRQLKSVGFSFDWQREINTTDPKYYKWTQWIFLKLYEKGLAYKDKIPINWCLSCKIGLANEEVIDGQCERCGGQTEKREREQWLLAITKYADRLDKDLDEVNFLERIKIQQRNWIGKSFGTEVDFNIVGSTEKLTVFTTRVDTLFSAAFMVIAPEHKLITKIENKIGNLKEVKKYLARAKAKKDIDRSNIDREKTGVELQGVKAINPINNKKIPVWVGDFVIGGYGTGAVFGDAHDVRDFVMAKKYHIPLTISVVPNDVAKRSAVENKEVCFATEGILINSGVFSGMKSSDARPAITKWLEKELSGREKINYKLRDWIFSRQHYWGEPIPIIFCDSCGTVPVPEKNLPVELPKVKNYEPTDTGESPLAAISRWVNVSCPKCNGKAKRETDTMPNWAGSSWYFLRYIDVDNDKELASKKKLKHWLPVDWYNGGMEHTTLHLLYSRFWHKFLYDIGVVPTNEPYAKRTAQGMILAEGGVKMSKSKGNVVNPDKIVKQYGADVLRVYEMFIGPFDQAIAWNDNDITGTSRFLEKVYGYVALFNKESEGQSKLKCLLHQTIKKVNDDIEGMNFNTAISQLMIFINEAKKISGGLSCQDLKIFLQLLAPFAPHLTEELWYQLGEKTSIHLAPWPKAEKKYLVKKEVTIVVQVRGRVRAKFNLSVGVSETEVLVRAKQDKIVQKYLAGQEIKKIIFIKDKLINLVL